jgi:hypothetical protein
MAKYSVLMQRTASATLSVGGIQCPAASMRRIKIYDVMFGSEATPADVGILWQLQRSTTTSTSTAVTPQALDPADAAAVSVAQSNSTIDPSLTAGALPLTVPLNQRASFRWVAAPGSEIVVPATASNGVYTRTPTLNGGTPAVSSTQLFEEQ